jgi:hypothetical protein
MELLEVDQLRMLATRLSPASAEVLAMIEISGAVACTRVINDLYRPDGAR